MMMFVKLWMMTVNERLAYARKKLHLTQAQFSKKISVTTGFLSSMEIGDRKINPRMIKIINLTTGISSKWLESGEGEMFVHDADLEIEEIVSLYRQLNPFFKGYFKRKLLEIINYENSKGYAVASEIRTPLEVI
jgi:transcriptional regulator with XRE-family HTH domain